MSNSEQRSPVKGVYLEFRKGGVTNMFILVDDVASPKDNSVIPFTVLWRRLSATAPNGRWGALQFPSIVRTVSPTTKALEQDYSLTEASDILEGKLKGVPDSKGDVASVLLTLESMAAGGHELYMKPLTVELTDLDVVNIQEDRTPERLWNRVRNARLEAGFDSKLWAEVS
jgi:hypothetical protein